MVTGKTLKQVIRDIYEYWEDTGKLQGVDDDLVDQYLSGLGYAIQRIHHEYLPNQVLLPDWPLDPFAPIHIVDVFSINPTGMHAVVMGADGKIYDPSNRKIKKLTEYQRVFSITGIWKVTDNLIDLN